MFLGDSTAMKLDAKTCRSGKRRFSKHGDAVRCMRLMKRCKQLNRSPKRIYHCPLCDGWHVTSQDYREWD